FASDAYSSQTCRYGLTQAIDPSTLTGRRNNGILRVRSQFIKPPIPSILFFNIELLITIKLLNHPIVSFSFSYWTFNSLAG
ncbi:MAG: hypothetical protein ACKPKO_61035, partial [Candidatus Fonsibacter sp.]